MTPDQELLYRQTVTAETWVETDQTDYGVMLAEIDRLREELSARGAANCATCKHWTDDTHYMGVKHVRRCASPKLAEPADTPNDVDTSDMLFYSYDEGGRFYTGPRFGCVHWEAK